jgi:hypothetical protein
MSALCEVSPEFCHAERPEWQNSARPPRLVSVDDSLGGEATRGVPLGCRQREQHRGRGARWSAARTVAGPWPTTTNKAWLAAPFRGDPSSNRGHHGFQSWATISLIVPESLQTNGIGGCVPRHADKGKMPQFAGLSTLLRHWDRPECLNPSPLDGLRVPAPPPCSGHDARCELRAKAAPALHAGAPRGSLRRGRHGRLAPLGGWGGSFAHGRPSGKAWRCRRA